MFEDEYESEYADQNRYDAQDVSDDTEDWEIEAYFYDNQDWKGLVEYRYQRAENNPGDPDCQWGLGEAYVLLGEYEKAISLLSDLHKHHPDDPNIQHSLLDALFADGRDDTAVEWISKPNMIRLDQSTLNFCYHFVEKKRKPRTVDDLYIELIIKGYTTFDAEQLMSFLRSDNRFLLKGSNTRSYDCYVSINKKDKG